MKTFAEQFTAILDKKGLTVADVARRSGIDQGTLHHYRKGDYEPKRERIKAIAKALGVDPRLLSGYEEDELTEAEALRAELISKIQLMDDATVTVLNQLADSILAQRQP